VADHAPSLAALLLLCLLPILLMDGADAGYAVLSVSAYDNSSGGAVWGLTASGAMTRAGLCACGTGYAFGTLFVLPSWAAYTCQDRGSQITDRNLDLWRSTRAAALRLGRRRLRVLVVRP
jgi:3D (Asp-Asp-Asp) domain-containing protein